MNLSNAAVIILNYNSGINTTSLVNKLISFKTNIHILVVDNMSTDNSYVQLVNEFMGIIEVDVIQSEYNGGYGYGNNFGIQYVREKYNVEFVGILNPDVIIYNIDIISAMIDALKNNSDLAIVGAQIIDYNNYYNINASGWNVPSNSELILNHSLLFNRRNKKNTIFKIKDNIAICDCVAGCFFFTRIKTFEKIGMFDEHVFLYNEENLLGINCKEKGYYNGFIIDKYYVHNHIHAVNDRHTFLKKIRVAKTGYVSRMYLCKKHYIKYLVPLLYFIEIMNRIAYIIIYAKILLLGDKRG